MIGSVHDELILEAPEALAQDMASLLLGIMRRVGSELLSPVPVDAEVEVLDSWAGSQGLQTGGLPGIPQAAKGSIVEAGA